MTSVAAESDTKPITLRSCRYGVERDGWLSLAPILEEPSHGCVEKVTDKDPHQLKSRNPRTLTAKRIKIAASIKNLDLSVQSSLMVPTELLQDIGRAEVAKLMGMSDVPAVCVDQSDPRSDSCLCDSQQQTCRERWMGSRLLPLELRELSSLCDGTWEEPNDFGLQATAMSSLLS